MPATASTLLARRLMLLHARLLLHMLRFHLLRLLRVTRFHLLPLHITRLLPLQLLVLLLLLLLQLHVLLILLRRQLLLLLLVLRICLRVTGIRRSVLVLLHFARVVVGRLPRIVRRTVALIRRTTARRIRRRRMILATGFPRRYCAVMKIIRTRRSCDRRPSLVCAARSCGFPRAASICSRCAGTASTCRSLAYRSCSADAR